MVRHGYQPGAAGLGRLRHQQPESCVRRGGNPTLRGNRVNGNGYQAVWVHHGGRGVVEDNDLTGNEKGAWLIAEDCQANVTRARNKE